MARFLRYFLPAALLIVGLPSGGSSAQDSQAYRLKPGARGELCVSCHVDFSETLNLPFVHTPVKAGNCADCHDPHASDHGKLLAADPSSICGSCHSDVVPQTPSSFHPDVVEGNCVSCHDPHGSKFKDNLRAQGNDLCFGCHEDLATAVSEAEFSHRPVQGDCLECHGPHASASTEALLASSVPELCVGCHDVSRDSFVKDHRNYPVANSDCTSCHDPHGSSSRGILWAGSHSPVTRGMCAQCHLEAEAPSPLETKRPGAELCRGCHIEMYNDTFVAKDQIHWPLVDRMACANCHNPHGSKHPSLLLEAEGTLCGDCHQDAVRRQQNSVTRHDPIADGECASCHDPHASNFEFLLAGPQRDVCGACHDWGQHSAHPMGDKYADQRNQNLTVDCLSCHRTHGTQHEKLAFFDPGQELCVQCHSVTR